MNPGPISVEQWKVQNAGRLIQCRWGGMITPEACRSYQLGRSRYGVYFRTGGTGYQRVNAEYVKCVYPDPCPHFMSDRELSSIPDRAPLEELEKELEKRRGVAHLRELHRLTDPREIDNGDDWFGSFQE